MFSRRPGRHRGRVIPVRAAAAAGTTLAPAVVTADDRLARPKATVPR